MNYHTINPEENNSDATSSGLCVICHSPTSAPNDWCTTPPDNFHPSNPKALLKDLRTYFLLKHIFKLSTERLENYLRQCPYPGEWIRVCEECTANYVNKCTQIFWELLEVKRKFQAARCQIITTLIKSFVENEEPFLDTGTISISDEVRRYVSQNEQDLSESAKDSFLYGDNLASQKLIDQLTEGIRTDSSWFHKNNDVDIKVEPSDNTEYSPDMFDQESNDGFLELSVHVKLEEDISSDKIAKPTRKKGRVQRKQKRSLAPAEDPTSSKFPCDQCSKVFSSRKYLLHHKTGSHGTTIHSCTEPGCTWTTKRMETLIAHMKRYHGTSEDLRKLTCPTCNKIFSKRAHLNYHKSHRHGAGVNYTCEFCTKSFSDVTNLKSHLALHHDVKEYQRFRCTHTGCNKPFYLKHLLERHEASHPKMGEDDGDFCSSELESAKSSKEPLKKPKGQPEGGSFQCNLCDKKFQSLGCLKTHKLAHEEEQGPQQCDQCVKVLKTPTALQRHIQFAHLNKFRYCCQICGKGQPRAITLLTHLAQVHFICSVKECNLMCDNRRGLWKHQTEVHRKEKDVWSCGHCEKLFAEKGKMIKHLSTHERPQGEGPLEQQDVD